MSAYPSIGECSCDECQRTKLNPEPADYLVARMARLRAQGKSPGNPKWYKVPTLPRFEFKAGLPPKFPRLPTGAEFNARIHGSGKPVTPRYVGGRMIELRKVKMGGLFTFPDIPGRVWIKCRGGFRDGRGGELHSCAPHVLVQPYTLHDIKVPA